MVHTKAHQFGLAAVTLVVASALMPCASAALAGYSQDFETMSPDQGYPPNDLSADGWLIYGFGWDANPYTGPANILYDYGPFEAANGFPGSIQGVATDEGGPAQGDVVLAKYSDYNNTGQLTHYVQALTYQQQSVSAADVGLWRFTYDAKIGNLVPDSSASAFIQVQDPTTFFLTSVVVNDSTNLPVEWSTYSLDLLIDSSMVGSNLQFGFSAISTDYNGSGVFYDNLRFSRVPLPAAVWLFGSALLGLLGLRRTNRTT